LKGGELTFSAERELMDNKFTVEYKLKIDGDKLKGKGAVAVGDEKREFDIAGKRVQTDKEVVLHLGAALPSSWAGLCAGPPATHTHQHGQHYSAILTSQSLGTAKAWACSCRSSVSPRLYLNTAVLPSLPSVPQSMSWPDPLQTNTTSLSFEKSTRFPI